MTHSLMIAQQDAPPIFLEFPTHKAAEIAARELRAKSDSLQIINNSSGKVTNFSAVLAAEAWEEEKLSAARHQAHIESLPDKEIRRIYAQHKEELDRWENRRRMTFGSAWAGNSPHLHYAIKHRMGKIEEHDKLERQWVEAAEELCGVSRESVNFCAPAQECETPSYAPFRSRGEYDIGSPSTHFLCWAALMSGAAAVMYLLR